MDRRAFLKNLGLFTAWYGIHAGVGAGLIGKVLHEKYRNDTFGIYENLDDNVDFMEASQLGLRMDRLMEQFPKEDMDSTQEDLINWTIEVLPFFSYEDAIDKVRVPDAVFYSPFNGNQHFHVSGRSNCEDWAVLNYRFANEHSSWYGKATMLGTLVHELVHVQQGQLCDEDEGAPRESIENTAQIVMLEVLAAMANDNNYDAARVLVEELRYFGMGTAKSIALRNDREYLFDYLFTQIHDYDEVRAAQRDKSKRQWAPRMDELEWILQTYVETPMNIMFNSINNDKDIYGLALPDTMLSYEEIEENKKYKIVTTARYFRLDDLAYFLDHAEDMVPDIIERYKIESRGTGQ